MHQPEPATHTHTSFRKHCSCLAALCAMLLMLTAGVARSQTVSVANTLASGYSNGPAFPNNCPGGQPVSNVPSGYHIERPHVIYNDTTRQYVLWGHYDNSNYTTAQAIVATSATECGPYTISQTFQPLGLQVRDDFVFKDTDGSAYFLAASNKNGGANDAMAIWRLTPDYLTVDSSAGTTWVNVGAFREAPVVFKSGSVYYLVTSQAAGWFPSQGAYNTSTAMMSGWSAAANLGNKSTFGGQTSGIRVIQGSQGTAFILSLDHLGGNTARDDGALYFPLQPNNASRTLSLDWIPAFQVNLQTGALNIPGRTNLVTSATSASSLGDGCHSYFVTDGDYGTQWCASSASFPAWWQVDLGSSQQVNEIDISWYMVKGSEAYYKYQIQYGDDGVNFATLDKTANRTYGFTNDIVNIRARYIRLNLTDAVIQNGGHWYTPRIWEVKLFGPSTTNVNVGDASFEQVSTDNYAYNPGGSAWTFSGSGKPDASGVSRNNANLTDGNLNSPDGNQVAFLQGTGTITQTVGGFTPGKVYTIRFAASQRQNWSGQAGETFGIAVNGTMLRSFKVPQDADGYQDFSVNFTPAASSNTIAFVGTNTNSDYNTVFLDNVRITTPNF